MTSDGTTDQSRLDTLGKAVALTAALLPVVGVGVRLVAFSASSAALPATRLSWAASLTQLTVTGARNVFIVVVYVLAIVVARWSAPFVHFQSRGDRFVRRLRKLDRETTTMLQTPEAGKEAVQAQVASIRLRMEQLKVEMSNLDDMAERMRHPLVSELPEGAMLKRPWHRVAEVLPLALLFAVIVFLPGWPLTLLTASGAFFASLYLSVLSASRGRVSLSNAWPVIAIVVVTSAIAGGLNGDLPGVYVAAFSLSPTSTLPDGNYIVLGEEGSMTFLLQCGSGEAVAIPDTSINEVSFLDPPQMASGPSLVNVLRGQRVPHLGLSASCDGYR